MYIGYHLEINNVSGLLLDIYTKNKTTVLMNI